MGVTCSTVANRGKKGGMRWTYKKESELNTTTTPHVMKRKEHVEEDAEDCERFFLFSPIFGLKSIFFSSNKWSRIR